MKGNLLLSQFYLKISVLALYFCCISSNFGSFSVFLFAFSLWAVKKNEMVLKQSFTKCFGLSFCLFAMALNQFHKWEDAFSSLSETRSADRCVWTTGALLGFAGGRHFITIISKASGARASVLQMRDLVLSEVTGSCPSSKGLTLQAPWHPWHYAVFHPNPLGVVEAVLVPLFVVT